MRAYPTRLQAGIQGLSDTLGGTAEFQRETEQIHGRQRLADRELQQRQVEEERRARAFEMDLQQATQKAAQEKSERDFYFGQAQQELGKQRDTMFADLMGGPASPDQAAEMERIDATLRHLSPENAPLYLDQIKKEKAQKLGMQALTQVGQDIMRPVTEGTVQDPMAQQQLQAISGALGQVGQMSAGGMIEPDAFPRFLDQALGRQQDVLKDTAKRQADFDTRQMSMAKIDQTLSTMDPMTSAPKMRRLLEVKQLVGMGAMDERQAMKEMLQAAYDVEVILPEEKEEALRQEMQMQFGRQGGIYGQAGASRQSQGTDIPSRTGVSAGMPNQRQAGARTTDKAGFAAEVRKLVNPSPQDIRQIMAKYGVTDLSPQEEASLFGG